MKIKLTGLSPDRIMSVLSSVLIKNELEPVDGYFSGDYFNSDEDVSPETSELIKNYFAPETLEYWIEKTVRPERNRLLSDSDYTVLPDSNLPEEDVKKWRAYRARLRDFTGTLTEVVRDITWPVKPA